MSLRNDIDAALADLRALRSVRVKTEGAADLVDVRTRLVRAIRRFQPKWETAHAFVAAALFSPEQDRKLEEQRAQIRRRMERFHAQLENTPTQPRRGGHYAQLEAALNSGTRESGRLATSVWRAQKDRVATLKSQHQHAVSPEDAVAVSLDNILDRLNARSWDRPPSSPASIDEHQRLLSEATELAKRLETIEVPDRVALFLKRAAHPSNADFSMMTPDVYQWLRQNSAFGRKLKIRQDD